MDGQSVSGAVGAIDRHSSVFCASSIRMSSPSSSPPGTYLNISSTAWPLVASTLAGPLANQAGFVLVVNPAQADACLNMSLGNGCCGSVWPDGSVGPGRRWIGRRGASELRTSSSADTGRVV